MHIGETFIPWKAFDGSFVPEWLERRPLAATAKLLYARLCRYAGEDGRCFPGQAALAEDLCISTSTVEKNVKTLRDNRLIITTRQRFKGSSNYYFLVHEWNIDAFRKAYLHRPPIVAGKRPQQLEASIPPLVEALDSPEMAGRRESVQESHAKERTLRESFNYQPEDSNCNEASEWLDLPSESESYLPRVIRAFTQFNSQDIDLAGLSTTISAIESEHIPLDILLDGIEKHQVRTGKNPDYVSLDSMVLDLRVNRILEGA